MSSIGQLLEALDDRAIKWESDWKKRALELVQNKVYSVVIRGTQADGGLKGNKMAR